MKTLGAILFLLRDMSANYGWGLLAVITYILHMTLKLPVWFTWIAAGCWIASSVLELLFITLISKASPSHIYTEKENKNPYSRKG